MRIADGHDGRGLCQVAAALDAALSDVTASEIFWGSPSPAPRGGGGRSANPSPSSGPPPSPLAERFLRSGSQLPPGAHEAPPGSTTWHDDQSAPSVLPTEDRTPAASAAAELSLSLLERLAQAEIDLDDGDRGITAVGRSDGPRSPEGIPARGDGGTARADRRVVAPAENPTTAGVPSLVAPSSVASAGRARPPRDGAEPPPPRRGAGRGVVAPATASTAAGSTRGSARVESAARPRGGGGGGSAPSPGVRAGSLTGEPRHTSWQESLRPSVHVQAAPPSAPPKPRWDASPLRSHEAAAAAAAADFGAVGSDFRRSVSPIMTRHLAGANHGGPQGGAPASTRERRAPRPDGPHRRAPTGATSRRPIHQGGHPRTTQTTKGRDEEDVVVSASGRRRSEAPARLALKRRAAFRDNSLFPLFVELTPDRPPPSRGERRFQLICLDFNFSFNC
eukprot:1175815-Prorocentrum_minimum.AAC.3